MLGLLFGAIGSSIFIQPQIIEKEVLVKVPKKNKPVKETINPAKEKIKPKEGKNTIKNQASSSKTNKVEEDSTLLAEIDTSIYYEDSTLSQVDSQFISMAQNSYLQDTISNVFDSDDTTIEEVKTEKPIEVQTEELIAKNKLPIISLVKVQKQTKADSSISNLADIKSNKPAEFLNVEFWDSPINYKGYKYSNNTLVVYGLDYFPNQSKVYKTEKGLVFKYLNELYPISETLKYTRYSVLADSTIINQIKNIE